MVVESDFGLLAHMPDVMSGSPDRSLFHELAEKIE